MYKITLFDETFPSGCSGVVCFFTEDIEDFQKRWLKAGDISDEQKDRFIRSKEGEIVTDYYSDDPELNIVQQDTGAVYGEKEVTIEDVTFEAFNAYNCSETYHVDRWDIHFKWIRFGNEYYRIASYNANGVCQYDDHLDRWEHVTCYGNPVLENDVVYELENRDDRPEIKAYAENCIRTVCFLTNWVFENEQSAKENIDSFKVTDEVMDRLFSDVIGEAG
ncbi:MAG: hypothetical protein J1F11_09140 [Oscillospiraceae bacterium]|nr:hypothetical protein [Oscillospiraceae bacterium]